MYLISMIVDTMNGAIYFDFPYNKDLYNADDINRLKEIVAGSLRSKKKILVKSITIFNMIDLTAFDLNVKNAIYHVAVVANTSEGLLFLDTTLNTCPKNTEELTMAKYLLTQHIRLKNNQMMVIDIIILNIQQIINPLHPKPVIRLDQDNLGRCADQVMHLQDFPCDIKSSSGMITVNNQRVANALCAGMGLVIEHPQFPGDRDEILKEVNQEEL